MLGYSPASAADGVTIPLPELAHQLACVTAFKDRNAPPTVRHARAHLGLFSVGFLIAADERDMMEILEALHGMEVVVTETMQRGILATIVNGTLTQWQRVVKLACHPQASVSCNTRHAFNMVYHILTDRGLRDIFDDVKVTEQPDHTFLLEDHR
jgi:hypothetical protein